MTSSKSSTEGAHLSLLHDIKYASPVSSNYVKIGRFKCYNRANSACFWIIMLSATFIAFRNPSLRNSNPLLNYESVEDSQYHYLTYDALSFESKRSGYDVKYTERGFVIDGKASILLGGSIHYARSTPDTWDSLLTKAKEDGLNLVQLYIFWNFHEPKRGSFYFADRGNLTHFFERVMAHGLFVHLRFGPYVCAEWNRGGLPLWLDRIPGMKVRSNSESWKQEMKRIILIMINIARPYFAANGGPIIMAQIENEYNGHDRTYVAWLSQLVRKLGIGIPWTMCNGASAVNTISTCNDNDCFQFAKTHAKLYPSQPFVWTENEAWYEKWATKNIAQDRQNDQRSPEQVAYVVARWFAVGGAMHNYYMYHGGNNFGRTASAGVTTMYADGAILHHDGLDNEPKRSHLRKLHHTLIRCNKALLSNERQLNHAKPLGPEGKNAYTQRAYIYGNCSFLENTHAINRACFRYQLKEYCMPPQTIVILDHNNVLYNTSDVVSTLGSRSTRSFSPLIRFRKSDWKIWSEWDVNPHNVRDQIVNDFPLEQLLVTQDTTDYLMYQNQVRWGLNGPIRNKTKSSILKFISCDANSFLVFMNGEFIGEQHLAYPGDDCSNIFRFDLGSLGKYGANLTLSILSISLGIHSLGEMHQKGLVSDVQIDERSLVHGPHERWVMFPGLVGEQLKLYESMWSNSVPWRDLNDQSDRKLTSKWYMTKFVLKQLDWDTETSVLLDCEGMNRGRIYLNGHDLGRYWLIRRSDGTYVQRYYTIPVAWLHAGNQSNYLVIFEELRNETIESVRIVTSTMRQIDAKTFDIKDAMSVV